MPLVMRRGWAETLCARGVRDRHSSYHHYSLFCGRFVLELQSLHWSDVCECVCACVFGCLHLCTRICFTLSPQGDVGFIPEGWWHEVFVKGFRVLIHLPIL